MKMARVEEIKESRDGSQRVVIVTYTNVKVNKKGNWIGTPVTVERCVKDLVLVDAALDDSTLSPEANAADEEKTSEAEISIKSSKPEVPQAKPNIPSIACEVRRSQRIQAKRNRMGRQTLDPEVVGTGEDRSDPDYQ